MYDPTNTYEYRRDVQAETHEQDEEFIDTVVTEQDRAQPNEVRLSQPSQSEGKINATEYLNDPDNAYDIWRDSLVD